MTTLTQQQAEEARGLVKYMLKGGGETVLDTAQKLLLARYADALAPPTPEEVTRHVETIHAALHDQTIPIEAGAVPAALTYLRDWAARAQALEARDADREKTLEVVLRQRDGAIKNWETVKSEAESLRSRVVTLEAENARLSKHHADRCDERNAERVRAEAAERRVAELEAHSRQQAQRCEDVAKQCRAAEQRVTDLTSLLHEYTNATEEPMHRGDPATGIHEDGCEGCAAEGRKALVPPATHTAPAGLLEAVGRIVPFLRLARRTEPSLALHFHGDEWGAILDHGDVDAVLAACDSAKGGEKLDKARVVEALRIVRDTMKNNGRPSPEWDSFVKGRRDAAEGAAHMLGLTLATPPSGPGVGASSETSESAWYESHEPFSCSGSAPTPTPEMEQETDGRWLAESRSVNGAMAYGTTPAEAVAKVRQVEKDAAPEVVWEGDGVRVLANGTPQEFWANEWKTCEDTRSTQFARALAEAMRANQEDVAAAQAFRRAYELLEDPRGVEGVFWEALREESPLTAEKLNGKDMEAMEQALAKGIRWTLNIDGESADAELESDDAPAVGLPSGPLGSMDAGALEGAPLAQSKPVEPGEKS